jgi:heme/copper-type cytochrome/quinol oxidase subunit 1
MKIRSKPYELFGVAAVLLFAISFIPLSRSVDINLHDTYFVISMRYIYRLLATVFLFIWLLYCCFNNILFSKKLTWVHVILSILPPIIFLFVLINFNSMDGIPRRYYTFTEFESKKHTENKLIICGVLLIAILVGQSIFLINLICGILKRALKPANKM